MNAHGSEFHRDILLLLENNNDLHKIVKNYNF